MNVITSTVIASSRNSKPTKTLSPGYWLHALRIRTDLLGRVHEDHERQDEEHYASEDGIQPDHQLWQALHDAHMDDSHEDTEQQRQLDQVEEVQELPLVSQVHLLKQLLSQLGVGREAKPTQSVDISVRFVDSNMGAKSAAQMLSRRAQQVCIVGVRAAGHADPIIENILSQLSATSPEGWVK